jgi:hypothetical protein
MSEDRHIPKRSGSFAIVESRVPVAGHDYPADLASFMRMFATEGACRAYVEQLRFPAGFVCSACGDRSEPWRSGTGLLGCRACRAPLAITDGMIFHGSTVPLRRWLRVLWEAAQREACLSVVGVQRVTGVGVEAAADVLDRVRRLMATPPQRPLSREVVVSTTRLELGDRADERPTVVLVFGEEGGKPRARMRLLARGHAREIARFVLDNVERGSAVLTAPWRGFTALAAAGFRHRTFDPDDAVAQQRAEQVWSLLKLWLWNPPEMDAHALQGCLDDFTFRFNRREYPKGLLFYRLMMLAAAPESPPEAALAVG